MDHSLTQSAGGDVGTVVEGGEVVLEEEEEVEVSSSRTIPTTLLFGRANIFFILRTPVWGVVVVVVVVVGVVVVACGVACACDCCCSLVEGTPGSTAPATVAVPVAFLK